MECYAKDSQKGLQLHEPDEYLEPKWLRYPIGVILTNSRNTLDLEAKRKKLAAPKGLPRRSPTPVLTGPYCG